MLVFFGKVLAKCHYISCIRLAGCYIYVLVELSMMFDATPHAYYMKEGADFKKVEL